MPVGRTGRAVAANRSAWRRSATTGGWALGAATVAAAAVAGVTARTVNGAQRPALPYTFTPFELGVPAEKLSFTAADGVDLAGWWLSAQDLPGRESDPRPERVVICVHGHRGNKADMLGIGSGLWRAGNTVMMFDFRGCGESGDGRQSLAHAEQQDLVAAVDLVRRRSPRASIAVVGFSMGASTAVLTAARDPRIETLVLDSPFATMSDVIATAYRRFRLPSAPLLPLADLATRLRYGYTFAQVRPIDVIADVAPRPILLLHGAADAIIPVSHAHDLYAAARGPKRLEIFAGADHCGGYFADRPGYIDLVANFLDATRPARDQSR